MTTQNIIAGLQLTQLYRNRKDTFATGADHDVIYIYATDRPLSEEHVNTMIDLGFHQEFHGADLHQWTIDLMRAGVITCSERSQ